MSKNLIMQIGYGLQGDKVLSPAYGDGEEIMRKLKPGQYKVTLKLSRNPEFHKLAFAFLNKVFEFQSAYTNRESMRKQLSIDADHFDHYFIEGSKICIVPRSWAFDELDEIEFQPLIAKIIEAAITRFDIPRDADWLPDIFVENFNE